LLNIVLLVMMFGGVGVFVVGLVCLCWCCICICCRVEVRFGIMYLGCGIVEKL
jgi:vacuolar-type H+-ATPase subunit I/STV1